MTHINWMHLHLMLIHFPIAGVFFGFLLFSAGLWMKNNEVKKVSLGFFVLIALMTIPTYIAGQMAEDSIKPLHLSNVDNKYIDPHCDAATASLVTIELIGAASIVELEFMRRKKRLLPWLFNSLIILSVIAIGFIAWTGNLGGEICHPEVRPGFKYFVTPDGVPSNPVSSPHNQ